MTAESVRSGMAPDEQHAPSHEGSLTSPAKVCTRRAAPEDRILLVDDSRSLRLTVGQTLRRLGFEVVEAASGEEGLDRLAAGDIQLVLSDWMMPGVDGPTMIRRLRERSGPDDFHYVIMMTAKQDKAALAIGFDAGADDFIAKPLDGTELAARLRAGRRLVALHNTLAKQKKETENALISTKEMYGKLQADLAVASTLQREYLPPPVASVNGTTVASLCRFAGHVGGDHVGYFPIGEHSVGIFSIDVSGHGVASSLLAIRLAQFFAPRNSTESIAFERDTMGRVIARPPQEVLTELNNRTTGSLDHDLYFTMAYAVVDLPSGDVSLCSAGHWPAIVFDPSGAISFSEIGMAPPIGLLEDATFPAARLTLRPGERLMLYSDGITEAEHADGSGQLGQEGIRRLVSTAASESMEGLLPTLWHHLAQQGGETGIDDDVSAIVIERPMTASNPTAVSKV
ncbi:MAG: SpoIIE family protein phosphatase [Pseudomonadota bacterium]